MEEGEDENKQNNDNEQSDDNYDIVKSNILYLD